MSTDTLAAPLASGTVKYLVGPHDSVEHAVSEPAIAKFVRHSGKFEFAPAACGTIVAVAHRFGEYGNSEHRHRKHCPHCGWIVALQHDTTTAELHRYVAKDLDAGLISPADRLSTILKAILDSDGGEDDLTGYETEGRITKLSTVLAHISSHTPELVVCEDCGDGVDCDHPDRTAPGPTNCPDRRAICGACTVFSGSWAGEWEGWSLDECTVEFPCSTIAAAAKHALVPAESGGRR